ncbi:MAG: pentapeptide repeat-containing protein, partial [Alphaproteobacteria bacterium]|nr:pentapeptide repeat-containing protein [Alphaproteobacteria bacterium]
MSLQTYTASRRNYQGLKSELSAAAPKPVMNFALDGLKPQKSSIRFDNLKPAPTSNAARLQKVQLAGGGELLVQNPSGTTRGLIQAVKDKMAELKIKRTPIIAITERNADLSGMDLSGMVLTGGVGSINLSNAKMKDATLIGISAPLNAANADMENVTVRDSRLDGSIFTGANLAGANFIGENSATNLKAKNVKLQGTNLGGAHLTNSDFTGANVANTNFGGSDVAGVNMEGAKGALNLKQMQPGKPMPSYMARAMQLRANYMHGP